MALCAAQTIWRSTALDAGGLFFRIKVVEWGNPPGGWKTTARVIIKKIGGGDLGTVTKSGGSAFIMGGYSNDEDDEFQVSVCVQGFKDMTHPDWVSGQREQLVKFVVQTFGTCTTCPSNNAMTWHNKANVVAGNYSNRVGADTDPANNFWFSSGPKRESWLKVDAPCVPPPEMTASIRAGCKLESAVNALICPCDKEGSYPGSQHCGSNKHPTCKPKWIYCNPRMPTAADTEACGTGIIVPIIGDIIRIDKCAGTRPYKECYKVTDVKTTKPCTKCEPPDCNSDSNTNACNRFDTSRVGKYDCLTLDHPMVSIVGGPGTSCANGCTSWDKNIFHLSAMLARTLQNLGWAENIGGFTVTEWTGQGTTLDGTEYQDYAVSKMTGYGHITRSAFHIAGNAGSRRWSGSRGFQTDKPFHIQGSGGSFWYAVDTSIGTTTQFVERWRQTIEMQIKSAVAGKPCPPGATCEGGNVYRIVDSWPPEMLELFIRETTSIAASLQVGVDVGKYFSFGMSFNGTFSQTTEDGSTYPESSQSVALTCQAWITLENLISIAKRSTGEGEIISSDKISVKFDLGGVGFSGVAKDYKDAFEAQGMTEDASTIWNTLFSVMEVSADWDINLVNGWTIDVSGFSSSGINPQVSIGNIKIIDKLVMTVVLAVDGTGSLGIAYDKKLINSKNIKVNMSAGLTVDAGGSNVDGRFAPSLGFFGSVGDQDPALSKILRGFEFDVNLIAGTAKIGRQVNVADWASANGRTKMKCQFKLEAQTGHPDSPVFSVKGDFKFEHTIIEFGEIWGSLVFRTEATFGAAIGSPLSGGLDPGPEAGAAGWCGIVWENEILAWLGFPFNVYPGVGIGFGAKFSFGARSSTGDVSGSQGISYVNMGVITWNLAKANKLRQHLWRTHQSFLSYIPLIGNCVAGLPILSRIGALGSAMGGSTSPILGQETIVRYLFRFHLVKSIAALGQAIKDWEKLDKAKPKDCKAAFVTLYRAMAPGIARHAIKYHWHQELKTAGNVWNRVMLFNGSKRMGIAGHPTRGAQSRGPNDAAEVGSFYCHNAVDRVVGDNKWKDHSPWITRPEFLLGRGDNLSSWGLNNRYEMCSTSNNGWLASEGKSLPPGTRYSGDEPICFFQQKCYWDWRMSVNACVWIHAKYESIDKNINALIFDFASHPALRGNTGLVNALVVGIQDFIWSWAFDSCKDFDFKSKADIEAFVEHMRPYWGMYDELADQAQDDGKFKPGVEPDWDTWEDFKKDLVKAICGNDCRKWWNSAGCKLLNALKFWKGDKECPPCFPDEKFGSSVGSPGNNCEEEGEDDDCKKCEGCSDERMETCQQAYFIWYKYAHIYQYAAARWQAMTMACQLKQSLCMTWTDERNSWGTDSSMSPVGNIDNENAKGGLKTTWEELDIPAMNHLGLSKCTPAFLWTMYHEIVANAQVQSALANALGLLENAGICSFASGGTCFQCPVYQPTVGSAAKFAISYKCGQEKELCLANEKLVADKDNEIISVGEVSCANMNVHGPDGKSGSTHENALGDNGRCDCGSIPGTPVKDVNCGGGHSIFCALCQMWMAENKSIWPGNTVMHNIKRCRSFDDNFIAPGGEDSKDGLYGDTYNARCGSWDGEGVPNNRPGDIDGPYNKASKIPHPFGTTASFDGAFCWQYHYAKAFLNQALAMYADQSDRGRILEAVTDWHFGAAGTVPFGSVEQSKDFKYVHGSVYSLSAKDVMGWTCQLGTMDIGNCGGGATKETIYDMSGCDGGGPAGSEGLRADMVALRAIFEGTTEVIDGQVYRTSDVWSQYKLLVQVWSKWANWMDKGCNDPQGMWGRLLLRMKWDLNYFMTLWRTTFIRSLNFNALPGHRTPIVVERCERITDIVPAFFTTAGTQAHKVLNVAPWSAATSLSSVIPGQNVTWKLEHVAGPAGSFPQTKKVLSGNPDGSANVFQTFLMGFYLGDWVNNPKFGDLGDAVVRRIERATQCDWMLANVPSDNTAMLVPWGLILHGQSIDDMERIYDRGQLLVAWPVENIKFRRQAILKVLMSGFAGGADSSLHVQWPPLTQTSRNRLATIAICNKYIGSGTNFAGAMPVGAGGGGAGGGVGAGEAGKNAGTGRSADPGGSQVAGNNINPSASGSNGNASASGSDPSTNFRFAENSKGSTGGGQGFNEPTRGSSYPAGTKGTATT